MSDTAAAPTVRPAAADPACDVAHGRADVPASTRTLVAVFASPVARFLLRYAGDAGYRPVLLEPDAGHVGGPGAAGGPAPDGLTTVASLAGLADEATDVVVCDHHRPELGPMLREIARVHRPIGLNIGSRTPAEIALATMAGLIADRNGRPGGFHF